MIATTLAAAQNAAPRPGPCFQKWVYSRNACWRLSGTCAETQMPPRHYVELFLGVPSVDYRDARVRLHVRHQLQPVARIGAPILCIASDVVGLSAVGKVPEHQGADLLLNLPPAGTDGNYGIAMTDIVFV